MPRIFITGSTDGLERAAATALINEGHEVVLHARSQKRVAAWADLRQLVAGIAVGDLASEGETRNIADQVNAIGRMDAIIHNTGVYTERIHGSTPRGTCPSPRSEHLGAPTC